MKKIIILLAGALFILSSCGISSRYSSSDNTQRFSDGIYSSTPSLKDKNAEQESKAELQKLTQKTQASQIYIYGNQIDTLVIPENMMANIRYDNVAGTSIMVTDYDPYLYYGGYYDPWYYGGYYRGYYGGYYSSYYRWHHRGWHNPWYYSSFHNPWYYGGWYDPWYYGGFYDPWYYAGYYNPWYYGWYGGWGPHYTNHHHHHVSYPSGSQLKGREVYKGSRLETSGRRVMASSSPSAGKEVRRVSTTSRNSFGTIRTSSTRAVQGRSTASYRRPAGTTASRSTGSSSTSTYNRSSSTGSSSVYNRSSSSQSRSYSSPTRSSYSSGSSSGGGYSRSSSSSGGRGGYSRSSSGHR